MATRINPTIPKQKTGGHSETAYTLTASSREKARMFFTIAGHRLLNINQWHKLAGPLSAVFTLTDRQGIEAHLLARVDDYFKINIPGSCPASGDGLDWVTIETLEDLTAPNSETESIIIKISPALNPSHVGSRTSHFLQKEASRTFVVQRHHHIITAAIHGPEELPKTTAENMNDKIKNAMITKDIWLGVSKLQWKLLVKGILNDI